MESQPANPDLWDGQSKPISIFGNTESIHEDLKNIKTSINHIADLIKNRKLKNNREEDIPSLIGFGQAA